MDNACDKEDEQASRAKNRRSSILKLPKSRNVFEELDEPCEDNGVPRSARRVSFASSNFVKPFVADPDKNTIWDTTYEEEINHTDSTHSSQEQTCSKVGSTFFHSTKTFLTSDMDITKGVGNENIQLPTQRFSIVDYAKKSNTKSSTSLRDQKSCFFNLTQQHSEMMEFTCNTTKNMELTCDISTVKSSFMNNKPEMEESLAADMEMTCAGPIEMSLESNQSVLGGLEKAGTESREKSQTMEFTCQFPQTVTNQINIYNDLESDNKENAFPVIKADKNKTVESMDLTCQAPFSVSVFKDRTLADMELTCQAPLQDKMLSDMESMGLAPLSVSAFKDTSLEDMQFTYQVPLKINPPTNKTLTDVELSCQVPKPPPALKIGVNKKVNISTEPWNRELDFGSNKNTPNKTLNLSQNQMSVSGICPMEISYINSTTNLGKNTPMQNTPQKHSKIPVKANVKENYTLESSFNIITKYGKPEENNCTKYEVSLITDDKDREMTCDTITQQLPEIKTLSPLRNVTMPSFHMNLTNLSVDDTKQLVNCTYATSGLDFPDILREKGERNDEEASDNSTLQNVKNISDSNLNRTETGDIGSGSPDISVFDFGKNKLAKVNDTYVLREKNKLKHEHETQVYEKSTDSSSDLSLGIVDIDKVDYFDVEQSERSEEPKMPKLAQALANFKLRKCNYTVRRASELKPLIEKIRKQEIQIKEYLENFEFKPINVPREIEIFEDVQKMINDRAARKKNEVPETVELSLEEKIRKHQERSGNGWQLENIKDNFYTFSTLFGTLVFTVEVISSSGTVISLKTKNELATDSHPIALYTMKLFLEKLNDDHIASAIGKSYDILSLLDYVHMTMVDLYDLQNELMCCHILNLDENFIATFKMISVKAAILCEISIDVCDLSHIDLNSVKITNKVGTINEPEFRNLIKRCSKGLHFFEEFVSCIEEYIKIKEKKK